MAAPHVARAAALFKAENPNTTPQQVIDMTLKSSSKPTTNCYWVTSQGDVDTLKEPRLFKEPPLSYTATTSASASSSPVVKK
jgi:subtilisin family serine protease